MTISIGDTVHTKAPGKGYWVGKVVSIKDCYGIEIVYVRGDPGYAVYYINELKLVDGEWWDRGVQ